MVKYFGDAQHGQIMLQESSEVSFGNPVITVILAIIALYVVIGSCLLCWKFSSVDKFAQAIKDMVLRRDSAIVLPTTSTTLTEADHAHRTLTIPKMGAGVTYTLPKPKKGLWFKFLYHSQAGAGASTGNLVIEAPAGAPYKGQSNLLFAGAAENTANSPAADKFKIQLATAEFADIYVYALDANNWYASALGGDTSASLTWP